MRSFRRYCVALLTIAVFVVGCSNTEPDQATPDNGTPGDAPATTVAETVAPGFDEFQGLWELTNAPGLEDGLGSVLLVADGPEDGDRYMLLSGDDRDCIEWYDYQFVGSTITTDSYKGEVPAKECDPEPPAFVELFDFGSQFEVTVEGNDLRLEAQGSVLEFDRTTNNLFDAFILESNKPEGATFNYILTNRLGNPSPSGDPDFPQFRVRITAVPAEDGSVDHLIWMFNSDEDGREDCRTWIYGTASGLTAGGSNIRFGVLPDGHGIGGLGCDQESVDPERLKIFADVFEFTHAPSGDVIRINYGNDERAFFIEADQ